MASAAHDFYMIVHLQHARTSMLLAVDMPVLLKQLMSALHAWQVDITHTHTHKLHIFSACMPLYVAR